MTENELIEKEIRQNLSLRKPQADSLAILAKVLADVLLMQNTYKKVIKMHSGDTPIAEALAKV